MSFILFFLVSGLSVLLYSLLMYIKYKESSKKVGLRRLKGFSYPIYLFLLFFSVLLALYWLLLSIDLPEPFELRLEKLFWLGTFLTYLGIGLFVWSFLYLGLATTVGKRRTNKLVTSGPYKYTRNPQFLGLILFLYGLIILSNSIYVLVFSLIWTVLFYLASIVEEKELETDIGEVYISYKKKVPRFF